MTGAAGVGTRSPTVTDGPLLCGAGSRAGRPVSFPSRACCAGADTSPTIRWPRGPGWHRPGRRAPPTRARRPERTERAAHAVRRARRVRARTADRARALVRFTAVSYRSHLLRRPRRPAGAQRSRAAVPAPCGSLGWRFGDPSLRRSPDPRCRRRAGRRATAGWCSGSAGPVRRADLGACRRSPTPASAAGRCCRSPTPRAGRAVPTGGRRFRWLVGGSRGARHALVTYAARLLVLLGLLLLPQ